MTIRMKDHPRPAMRHKREYAIEPEKRERLQRDARIQRILTASQRLFSTQAYDEIAIEDLAAAAGMSKGLLYHYFASKRDLYVATVAHVLTADGALHGPQPGSARWVVADVVAV